MSEIIATDTITAAALDYVEGWFDGDADRMRRALHPDRPSGDCARPTTARSRSRR